MGHLRRFLAGLAVALGLLGLVELGLRLVLGPPPPPVKVYRVEEARDGYIEVVQRKAGVQAVLRYQVGGDTPHFDLEPSAPRFAVLGGSSVHRGTQGIRPEQQFPGLLREATGFEVLNLGAPAFDSHDLAELTLEAVDLGLTGLVVYTGHNDIGNAWFFERFGSAGARWQAEALSLLENLQLYCQLRRLLDRGQLVEMGAHNGGGAQGRLQPDSNLSEERREVALRYLERNLRRIAHSCRRAGVELVLVTPASNAFTAPNPECLAEGVCAMDAFHAARELGQRDPERATALLWEAIERDRVPVRATPEVVELIRRVAEEEGVRLVDAAALLPRAPGGIDLPAHSLFQDHMHFTAEGQQHMADLLEPVLREIVEER